LLDTWRPSCHIRLQRDLTIPRHPQHRRALPHADCVEVASEGLDKLILNEEAIRSDLEDNWRVAEAIQTILRREG